MKQCSTCKQVKPYDQFYIEKRVKDGHSARCKACVIDASKRQRQHDPLLGHKYYERNKSSILNRKRQRYASEPERRIKAAQQAHKYYLANRDEIKERVKVYNLENQVRIAAKNVDYRKQPENIKAANERSRKYRSNPDNKAIIAHRTMQYTYRKYKAQGAATKAQLAARWLYYNGKCWICNQDAREFDHVKPLTKGGSNWPANLRPICRSCNARKGNTWPYPVQLRSNNG